MRPLSQRIVINYLGFWARLVLRRHRPVVVAVTGSVGKTTTKETIAAVLQHPDVVAHFGAVWKTPQNTNSSSGLPSAVLGYPTVPRWPPRLHDLRMFTVPLRALSQATVRPYPKYLVLEYGTSRLGEIARMVAMVPPTIGIVTAVGPAHLERMRSVEHIAEEKSQLIRHLPPTGLAILSADNPYTAAMDGLTRARVVKVPGRGAELAENISRAVCEHLGVPAELVERALRERGPVRSRLELLRLAEFTVINDAFNANPLSMQLGLDTLAERAAPGQRRVAILGDMAELGPESPRYHREVAAHARSRADLVIGVGRLAKDYAPDYWYPDVQACAADLLNRLAAGDLILVKGSHSIHLIELVRMLRRRAKEQAAPA